MLSDKTRFYLLVMGQHLDQDVLVLVAEAVARTLSLSGYQLGETNGLPIPSSTASLLETNWRAARSMRAPSLSFMVGLLVALEELELAPTFLAGAGARARGAGGRLVGGLDGAAGTDAIACAFFFDLDLDFFPMLDGILLAVVFVVEGPAGSGTAASSMCQTFGI